MAAKTFETSRDLMFFIGGNVVNVKSGVNKATSKPLIDALDGSKYAKELKPKTKE